jgi:hypothetical protein
MIRVFVAVLVALLVVVGIFRQMNLEHEQRQAELEREAQRQHVEALKQYDRDIKSFKQLGRMFQP